MNDWELDFYADLGRYVKCPRCDRHSDLSLSRPEALDDWPAYARSLSMELTKSNCLEFHQNPLLAWLWFKHQGVHPTSESPSFDHLLDGLEAMLSSDEPVVPPEDNEDGPLVPA